LKKRVTASKKKGSLPKKYGVEIQRYFDNIVSNISPLISVDESFSIRFANEPFLRFVKKTQSNVLHKNLFSVIKLTADGKQEFIENVEKSTRKPVQNCEFILQQKVYGYSVYRFGKEYGIILRDITEQKKLEKKVHSLHTRLLNLQEKERQKIAAELHDGVGQTILAAKLNFQNYYANPGQNRDRFRSGLALIDRASEELRDIYSNLYPSSLRELGLESTVRWYARHFLESQKIKTDIQLVLKRTLPDDIQVNLFRIIQEVFTNIIKHSKANRVNLFLGERQKQIQLHVSDNGHGYKKADDKVFQKGFGLENMRRRVEDMDGTISIASPPSGGLSIEIHIPVENIKNGVNG